MEFKERDQMSAEQLFMIAVIILILCLTGLISQCSYRLDDCQKAAIKANMKADDISKACHM